MPLTNDKVCADALVWFRTRAVSSATGHSRRRCALDRRERHMTRTVCVRHVNDNSLSSSKFIRALALTQSCGHLRQLIIESSASPKAISMQFSQLSYLEILGFAVLSSVIPMLMTTPGEVFPLLRHFRNSQIHSCVRWFIIPPIILPEVGCCSPPMYCDLIVTNLLLFYYSAGSRWRQIIGLGYGNGCQLKGILVNVIPFYDGVHVFVESAHSARHSGMIA